MADLMTWKGSDSPLLVALFILKLIRRLSGVINKFRTKTLGLDDLTTYSGASVTERLDIPWTYCFSPELVPKPKDWAAHIGMSARLQFDQFSLVSYSRMGLTHIIADVVGFYFLDLAQNYQPPADLMEFLNAGPPPVYIG